jgi:hypothetical protein
VNTKDYLPVRDGMVVSLVGVGGSGKSSFARSAIQALPASKKAFGFLSPAEAPSYGGVDMDFTPLDDPEWHPSLDSYKASGYRNAVKALMQLFKREDLGLVVVDTDSILSTCIFRDCLAPYNTDDPTTLGGNSRTPYAVHNLRFMEFIQTLDALRWSRHCHVIHLWHAETREVEGLGTPRKETEKVGGSTKTVMKWDEALLPVMHGSLRQSISTAFDVHFYAEPVLGARPFRCRLVAAPDATRLAKTRLPIMPAIQKAGELPNDWPTLLKMVEEGGK